VALGSVLLPTLTGRPFLKGLWGSLPLPGDGHVDVGTPLLFDVGVYLVVIGMTLTIVLSLAEE
jgi:multicomponent Na+:H+ antiporter subunit B